MTMTRTHLFFTAILWLFATMVSGQVSFSGNNFALPGAVYGRTYEILSDGNYLTPETDVFTEWDFSNLPGTSSGMFEVLSSADFSAFPNIPAQSVILPDISGAYLVVKNELSALYMSGFITKINGKTVDLLFDAPVKMFDFPLTPEEAYSHEVKFMRYGKATDFGVSIPNLDSMMLDVHYEVDITIGNDGNLVTPAGNYAAIRVLNHSIMNVDVWVKMQDGWTFFEDNMVSDSTKRVQFYTPEYGMPVYQIEMSWGGLIKSYEYMTESGTGLAGATMADFSCYPNPVLSSGVIGFTKTVGSVSIFDMRGSLVFSTDLNHATKLNLPRLAAGLYLICADNQEAIKLRVE